MVKQGTHNALSLGSIPSQRTTYTAPQIEGLFQCD